jgi:hypothetical protein
MSIATETPTKLDLACGQSKREGYFGVDVIETDDADQVLDLLRFPWPFADDSVEEVFCSHFVEHVPHWRPWFPDNRDGLDLFMDEIWRICKPDATVEIVHPYGMSKRALQDPTHCRYIIEDTWPYYSAEGRKQIGVDHYPTVADFEILNIANGFYPDWALKSDAARSWAAAHYWGVVTDLIVTLKALKM